MTNPDIHSLEQKLDAINARIRECKDPELQRALLIQMRQLMAELDRVVADPTRLNAAKPDLPK